MRLSILERGHRLRARIAMRLVPLVVGTALDDVAKTSLYRPDVFGRPWLALLREVMREPSDWTPGERELMAAFVSRQNACPYCVGIHTGTATLGTGSQVTAAALDGWREGGFPPRMTAAFALLEALARDPEADPTDAIVAGRTAGLTDAAIEDALAVAFVSTSSIGSPTRSATRGATRTNASRRLARCIGSATRFPGSSLPDTTGSATARAQSGHGHPA